MDLVVNRLRVFSIFIYMNLSVGQDFQERFSGAVEAFSRRNGSGHGLHGDTSRHRSTDNAPSSKDVVSGANIFCKLFLSWIWSSNDFSAHYSFRSLIDFIFSVQYFYISLILLHIFISCSNLIQKEPRVHLEIVCYLCLSYLCAM